MQSIWQFFLRFEVIHPGFCFLFCLSCSSSVEPRFLVSCRGWIWNCSICGGILLLLSLSMPIALVWSCLNWAPRCREAINRRFGLSYSKKVKACVVGGVHALLECKMVLCLQRLSLLNSSSLGEGPGIYLSPCTPWRYFDVSLGGLSHSIMSLEVGITLTPLSMLWKLFWGVFRSFNAIGEMVTDGTSTVRQNSSVWSSRRDAGRAPGLRWLHVDL